MGQFVKLRPGQVHVKVFRAFRCCRNKRKVDIGCSRRRKFFLSLLSGFFQSLQRHLVNGKVDAFIFLKLGQHIVGNLLVEIVTAQSVVTIGCQNFDNAVTDFDNGHIKCTAAQIVYHDLLFFFVVKSICQRSSRRLVDNTLYIHACNLACIFGCLTLCVIEVSRYGNYRFRHFFTQIVFCIPFQLL